MAQTYNLGKVAMTPKGAYNSSTTYAPLDIVTHNGSSYVVLQSVTGVTPPSSAYYQLIASKGDTGADGVNPTVTAGTATMLPVGSAPTVTNSGTTQTAIFDFGIPYPPLADSEVTTAKLADDAVTTSKLADGAVTPEKLAEDYALADDTNNRIKLYDTAKIVLESGTYKDANGTEKTANVNRLRNISPIPVSTITTLSMPDGYSMWIFRLDENLNLLGTLTWSAQREKSEFGNAAYINFAVRKTSAPNTNISEEKDTVQSGIVYYTSFQSVKNDVKNINEGIMLYNAVKKAPDSVSTGFALHYDGTSSVLSGFNLLKYRVAEGDLLFIHATVDNTEHLNWQGVYQFQTSESVATSNPTNLVGKTALSGQTGYIRVPSGATWLVICAAASNEKAGLYSTDNKSISNSSEIVEKYVNNATLLDRESVKKNSDKIFVFFSDIHAGQRNYKRIVDFCNTVGVDAIINGGDTVQSLLSESVDWYNTETQSADADVLTCVGNHDVWESFWHTGDPVAIYNKFTAPVAANVGNVVQPTGASTSGLNYYYKDYGNIRVIVLAAMDYSETDHLLWTSAQNTWLQGVLSDALTNNKAVICVNHSPFRKSKAVIDNDLPLNSWRDYKNNSIFDGIYIAQDAVDSVNAFISNGGEFVCWLTGHTHQDMVMTEEDYGTQFLLNIASAKYMYHSDGFSPSENQTDCTAYDCFDYIGIDTTNKLIKVWRIGYNEDASMRVRNRWAYDYANKQILSYS